MKGYPALENTIMIATTVHMFVILTEINCRLFATNWNEYFVRLVSAVPYSSIQIKVFRASRYNTVVPNRTNILI